MAFASAAAVVALVALAMMKPGERFGPTQAAADTLASIVSDHGATTSLGAGEFLYVERVDYSANSDNQGILAAQTSTVQQWLRTDGSGFQVTDRSGPTFFSDADRAAWMRLYGDRFPFGPQHETETFAAGAEDVPLANGSSMSPSDLPTDPDALWQLLQSQVAGAGGGPENWQLFQVAWDFMGRSSTPSPVRAALFEVVGRIEGVRYSGSVTDDVGRTAVSFSLSSSTNGPVVQEAMVDPASGQLLELRTISATTGTTHEAQVALASGTSDSHGSPAQVSSIPAPVTAPVFTSP
jgi:hypothetical protein